MYIGLVLCPFIFLDKWDIFLVLDYRWDISVILNADQLIEKSNEQING